MGLVEHFEALVSPPHALDRGALEAELKRALFAAESAWPTWISPESFIAALARAKTLAPDTAMADLIAADLYLAEACLQRVPAALVQLERLVAEVRPAVVRICGDALDPDDILQTTRERLLTGMNNTPPKLTGYTGRGPLGGWLRVVASRAALMALRTVRPRKDEHSAWAAETTRTAPELALFYAQYRERFERTVATAIAELSPDDRTLLRMHVLDGVSIDALAPIFQAHRATIARRVKRLEQLLLKHVVAMLCERERLSASEATSLCTQFDGSLLLSVRRILETGVP